MQRLGKILHRRDKSSRDEADWSSQQSVQSPPDPAVKPAPRPRDERAPRTLRPLPRRDTRSSIQSNGNVSPTEPPSPSAAARAAASAAMSPTTPRPLDATEQQLFQDFGHMSVNDGPRRASGSADVGWKPVTPRRPSAAQVDGGRPSDPTRRKPPPYPSSDNVPPTQTRGRQHSLVKKGSLTDLKSSQPSKPLPKSPSDKFEAEIQAGQASYRHGRGAQPETTDEVEINNIVDLTNTEDTSYHKQWAPAVTHETITQNVHEVRQEQITREIHTHDVYHRILPVIDFEVLPARHFVPVEGGYVEISADEVPGGAGDSAQKLIQQALANVASKPLNEPIIPARFSARSFEGTDGDYREYTTADGIKRTEQWWVHPPTMVNEAIDGAEVDFVNTKTIKGALRPTSPAANVIGLSPMLAQQRGVKVHSQKISTATEVPLTSRSHPGPLR